MQIALFLIIELEELSFSFTAQIPILLMSFLIWESLTFLLCSIQYENISLTFAKILTVTKKSFDRISKCKCSNLFYFSYFYELVNMYMFSIYLHKKNEQAELYTTINVKDSGASFKNAKLNSHIRSKS